MKKMRMVGSVVAAALMVFCGCGGGGDDSDAGTPSATGTWSLVDPGGNQDTMHLSQSGSQVSGNTDRGGTASGVANGSAYNITIAYANNYIVHLNVTINGDTMTGVATDSRGASGTVTATSSSINVSGTWYGENGGVTGTIVLQQSGNRVSGTFVQSRGLTGTVSGNVSGNHVHLILSYSSDHNTLDATVSGNTMRGSFVVSDGESGSFTAIRR
jgi:hypothetical protein